MSTLTQHLVSTGNLAVIREEFAELNDTYNLGYCAYILGVPKVSLAKVNKMVEDVGMPIRIPEFETKNEVSKELFLSEYEFGRYKNVREWISFIYRKHNKILTRKSLFKYVLSGQAT